MDSTTMAIRFDKARYIKTLRDAGQSQESAEALAEALDVAMAEYSQPLATKQDLVLTKLDLINMKTELIQIITRQTITLTALMAILFGLVIIAKLLG